MVVRTFCIHFARGMCARGSDCQYFHRIPTVADDAMASELHDCFGRERHSKHRDDMDGVGSFTNPSRTLYVGGIQVPPTNHQAPGSRQAGRAPVSEADWMWWCRVVG